GAPSTREDPARVYSRASRAQAERHAAARAPAPVGAVEPGVARRRGDVEAAGAAPVVEGRPPLVVHGHVEEVGSLPHLAAGGPQADDAGRVEAGRLEAVDLGIRAVHADVFRGEDAD